MGKGFSNSIGGSSGSAPVSTYSQDINNNSAANAARNRSYHVSHDGERGSLGSIPIPKGPNRDGSVDAPSKSAPCFGGEDKTTRVDKMRNSKKVNHNG
jgi:hypothetical protein